MTSPGDPLSTLGKALDSYTRNQRVMRYAASTLRRAREQEKTLDQILEEDKANGVLPTDPEPPA